MAGRGKRTTDYVRALIPLGFESFQINFWQTLDGIELPRLAAELRPLLDASGTIVSSLAVFGNPLETGEKDMETRRAWEKAIDAAPEFGCDIVCGFTGRVRGKPVSDSIPRLKEVWLPLVERAEARGVRIAFENCPMGGTWESGDWNIAFNPDAWELLFAALPSGRVGLEWEPCHQICQLIDPIPQLREWVSRVFHVHGKDAEIDRHCLATRGISGAKPFCWHRAPGFGQTDWTSIISILRGAGYRGAIDIEGWHDPVYRDELEMTGQVHALRHLQRCRGGEFVLNPVIEA